MDLPSDLTLQNGIFIAAEVRLPVSKQKVGLLTVAKSWKGINSFLEIPDDSLHCVLPKATGQEIDNLCDRTPP